MEHNIRDHARCGNEGRNFGTEEPFLTSVVVNEKLKSQDVARDARMAKCVVRMTVWIRAIESVASGYNLGIETGEKVLDVLLVHMASLHWHLSSADTQLWRGHT
jgi:hypothetical protein